MMPSPRVNSTTHPFAALLLLIHSTLAGAAPILETELASCAARDNDASRLQCYDRVYTQFSRQIVDIASGATTDNWEVVSSPSLLGANHNLTLKLEAEQAVKSRTQTVRPLLQLQCTDGNSAVSIHWGVYLGKNRTTMTTRIGDQLAVTEDWIIEDKYTVQRRKNNDEMIVQLKNSPRLVAQIAPYNASPITASFDLNNLSQHISTFAVSCAW